MRLFASRTSFRLSSCCLYPSTGALPARRIEWLSSIPRREDPARRWHSTSEATAEKTTPRSNRSSFKTIPVDPRVLEYIEQIGVGIRKQKPKRYRRSKTSNSNKRDGVLDWNQEKEFFRQQSQSSTKEQRVRLRKKPKPESPSHPSWLPPPPFATTLDQDDGIKRHPVKVIASVGSIDEKFPEPRGMPEVALAGRSNVGKSTLLNALLYGNRPREGDVANFQRRRGRVNEGAKLPKGIKAATSDRPGETRRITFYQLASDIKKDNKTCKLSMMLVDLPGYGFAYASEEKAREWQELMESYILHRGKSLKRVLLLIDARHGMKKADTDFIQNLESTLYSTETKSSRRTLPPIQLILTKCDLVSQADLARRMVLVKKELSDTLRREPSSLPVMLVSAKPGVGFNNIRGDRAFGGVLELQREIAALAPRSL